MTSITREEAIVQIADIKRRLEQMLMEPPFGHGGNETRDEARADDKARTALRHAADWLGDIVQPLTGAEQEEWATVVDVVCEDIDPGDRNDLLNDADRRNYIEYIMDHAG